MEQDKNNIFEINLICLTSEKKLKYRMRTKTAIPEVDEKYSFHSLHFISNHISTYGKHEKKVKSE